MALTILTDLTRNAFFLVSFVVSSKVANFHSETTFLYQKELGTNYLTLPIRDLNKAAIFTCYSDGLSLLISILSVAKG